MPKTTILRVRKISKRFPGTIANDHIDFDLKKGEIHALLGENGAGKTTLMNILSGLLKPDEGEIIVRDKQVFFSSPIDAIRCKIGMVHQQFMLIPSFTVIENIALCLTSLKGFTAPTSKVRDMTNSLFQKYEISEIDPDAEVQQLPAGKQQLVEIVKMLAMNQEILIFDEPTSVLTVQQTGILLERLKKMAKVGYSIVLITHKLGEALAISDRITVLRKGRVVGSLETRNTNKRELARMMVGRDLLEIKRPPADEKKKERKVLEVQSLRTSNKSRGTTTLKDISFSICKGEILGIGGVQGNGQSELFEAITGIRKVVSGKMMIKGCNMTNASPRKIIDMGVGYIPAKPMETGIALGLPVAMNTALRDFSPQFFNWGFLNLKNIHQHARKIIAEYNIQTSSEDLPVRSLSGGNQMKVVVAREMARKSELLILLTLTAGLDVGTIEFIHQKILEARKNAGVLLVSTDLDELLLLSDRVAIMFRGNLREAPRGFDREKLGLMMAGEIECEEKKNS